MKKCRYCGDPILGWHGELHGMHEGCFGLWQDESKDRSMKAILIDKCFDCCPYCTGPDWNGDKLMHTCQEAQRWIENPDVVPGWCPLPDKK